MPAKNLDTYLCSRDSILDCKSAIKKFGREISFFKCFVEIQHIQDIFDILARVKKYFKNVENVKKIQDKAHEKWSFPINKQNWESATSQPH